MKAKTKQILSIMNIVSWLLFVGVCIKTGAILISFIVSLLINPEASKNLYLGLNLLGLYNFNVACYAACVTLMVFLSGFKAYVLFLLIRIFKKINFVHPFSAEVSLLISGISYVALGIGILTLAGNSYSEWLTKKGVVLPDLQLYLGGGAEFMLMGGIIFVIAQVFKRGIEIQSENELTV